MIIKADLHCHACKRDGAEICTCGNRVCYLHVWYETPYSSTVKCLGCRHGWVKK